ncbi:hypothetical protein RND81_12G061700 [Saponaria officinalis]|uniref:Uncharacterized protein n=1 Tax=Saponaria officinalis TaxID=3572 RepID=A0AAW1H3S7_SAPOF
MDVVAGINSLHIELVIIDAQLTTNMSVVENPSVTNEVMSNSAIIIFLLLRSRERGGRLLCNMRFIKHKPCKKHTWNACWSSNKRKATIDTHLASLAWERDEVSLRKECALVCWKS